MLFRGVSGLRKYNISAADSWRTVVNFFLGISVEIACINAWNADRFNTVAY